jgi:hypothetical protein
MIRVVALGLAAILALPACHAPEVRCDHDLQPINVPEAKPAPAPPVGTPAASPVSTAPHRREDAP